MKKIYLAYLLLIILSACGSKNTNSVYLNGEIKGLGNDTLYIYGTDKFYNRMDTLLVKDDKFSATLTTDTLVSTWLQFSDGTEYPLYLNKGDKIKIKGSAAELTSLEITGNAPNEELTAFQKELKGLSTPSEKALEEKAEAFINSHPSSLVSIYLLEKYFVQKPQPDFSLIKEMTEHMTGGLKDRPYVASCLMGAVFHPEKSQLCSHFRVSLLIASSHSFLSISKEMPQSANSLFFSSFL